MTDLSWYEGPAAMSPNTTDRSTAGPSAFTVPRMESNGALGDSQTTASVNTAGLRNNTVRVPPPPAASPFACWAAAAAAAAGSTALPWDTLPQPSALPPALPPPPPLLLLWSAASASRSTTSKEVSKQRSYAARSACTSSQSRAQNKQVQAFQNNNH
eukprot:GHRR01010572.1.p3 GENE.GHRR01010572.1~~GHRR01010572.1.p3  ORF type:complete len:157 (-),score=55.42 GHRR01010572.1:279-749(-)